MYGVQRPGHTTRLAKAACASLPLPVVGHSMREVDAACIARVLDLATYVICHCSALMQCTIGKGAMTLTDPSMEEIAALLAGRGNRLPITASSSPGSALISGAPELLSQVTTELQVLRASRWRQGNAGCATMAMILGIVAVGFASLLLPCGALCAGLRHLSVFFMPTRSRYAPAHALIGIPLKAAAAASAWTRPIEIAKAGTE